MKVVILYYTGTNEDDVDTLEGVKGIAESCTRLKHQVTKVNVDSNNWRTAVKTPGDIFFNFVEDEKWDLYVKVGKALEKLGKAQVAHDLASFKFSTEKTLIKKILKKNNLSTPNYRIFKKGASVSDRGLKYPVIVKPAHEHAGIGISQASVVTNFRDLLKRINYLFANFGEKVIAEEYVKGREIHATVLGNGKKILILPLCEIGFEGKFKKNWSVYTYESKWDKKSWEYWDARVDSPAKLPEKVKNKINTLVLTAYRIFECRDIARFDVRISTDDKPYIVDVNINPSLNIYDEQDATVASIKAYGWTYDQFMGKLLEIAHRRARS